MSIKIIGIKDDGSRDVCGLARNADVMLSYARAADGILEPYTKVVMEDDAPQPRGVSTWTVYDRPRDWPTWYVARQFISEHRTGNMVLYRDLEALREHFARRGLTRFMRAESDDPVILETWL